MTLAGQTPSELTPDPVRAGDLRDVDLWAGRKPERGASDGRRRSFAAVLLFTAPVSVPILGFPVAPYHLLAPIVAILAATQLLGFFNRFYVVISSGALGIFVVGLMNGSIAPAPFLSAYHFLAPYLGLAAGALMIRKLGDEAWRKLAAISVIPPAVTLLLSGGAMTRSFEGGRIFSVGAEIPFLSGDAQVNSWGTYLVAWMLIGVYSLRSCPELGVRTRLVVLIGIALSTLCLSQSASRANTGVAVLAVVFLLTSGSRGRLEIRTRHRLPVLAAITIAALGVLGLGISRVADQERVVGTITAFASGDASEDLSGRTVRLEPMFQDISAQPIFGTGFHDFALNHPEFSSSSPHNQWVGTVHKLGLLGGIAFAWMMIPWVRSSIRDGFGKLLWLSIVMLGAVYDVFTAPPGGVLLLVIVGAHACGRETLRTSTPA